jgi:regulator of replication initiation timing
MVDFYSGLGFISRKKYDEVVEENEKLKRENAFLKEVIQKMNLKVFEEGSRTFQEAWKTALDKQLSVSTELAKSFFELLKEAKESK